MNTKKTASVLIFISMTFIVCANFVNAQSYTPLVRIPGLPATGAVNLSMYMVGLYNFLLSIVGIVAVMMLIIGGMRYITAAGNCAAIGDAKDIIQNAIFGLLLALLSWVFVSTINPDVLYIKSPGATLQSNLSSGIDLVCTKTNDPCVCWDGNPPAILPATPDDCAKECRASDQCNDFSVDTSCVAAEGTNEGYIDPDTGARMCRCYDQEDIPIGVAVNCNDACVDNCGWKFLVTKLDAHGHGNWESGEDLFHLDLDAEIWEMFLTNDGKYKGFNITAPSYTVGADTYHCAVLTIDEDSFPLNAAIDEYRIYWVKEGTSIGKVEENGGSFREDVESSGVANSWVECCSSIGGPACDINIIFPPAECDGNQRIWYSRYKDDITSYCGTCSSPVPPAFSISDTAFSPNGKITCTVINGNGFWRRNY